MSASSFKFIFVVSFLSLSALKVDALICPPAESYYPCQCAQIGTAPTLGYDTLLLSCQGQNLNDLRASEILNAFLAPGVSKLGMIQFGDNKLTYVPRQIKSFYSLIFINLENNAIETIGRSDLSFNIPTYSLSLSNNVKITTIAPFAFEGFY